MNTYPLLCPRCEQGPELYKVMISGVSKVLFVCFVCDATWLDESQIGMAGFVETRVLMDGTR